MFKRFGREILKLLSSMLQGAMCIQEAREERNISLSTRKRKKVKWCQCMTEPC